jgi:hypothetical protein
VEKPSNGSQDEELDDAVIAADDTGLIAAQHDIAEEGILESTLPDEDETAPEEQG